MGHFEDEPSAPATKRMPSVHCPLCGGEVDAVMAMNSSEPVDPVTGSIMLCAWCMELQVIVVDTFGIRLRVPTPEETASAYARFGDEITITRRLRRQMGD